MPITPPEPPLRRMYVLGTVMLECHKLLQLPFQDGLHQRLVDRTGLTIWEVRWALMTMRRKLGNLCDPPPRKDT